MSTLNLAHTPAAEAPPGMVSNLQNPHIRNHAPTFVLAIFGMCIATMLLTMRIYTKAVLARIFGIDDVFLLFAWAMSLVVQIFILYLKAAGLTGVHIWDISLADLKHVVLITTAISIVYLAFMAFAKFSILIFYMRLSPQRWFKYAVYATMALTATFSLVLMLCLAFACIPLKRVWDPTITEGHCINRGNVFMATAGLNAATDIIMLFLPMPIVFKLQVPRVQKIGLVVIFSVGSITAATSIVRLVLMPPLIANLDMPWALTTPSSWICIEANLVIICGSLPILRLFLKHTWPRLIGETSYGTGRSKITGQPGSESAELSNLERSRNGRPKRYSRMNDFTRGETLMEDERDGSETFIIDDKEASSWQLHQSHPS
ncbi:hypothetical protein CB0940_02363 [Cercospora beticola]|uniref:Rhodopsin domain-containing protein n=1 Tax=Cercospora beticola TaxID=122368 RepID=A0A2G5I1W9_CERBT|nr:hypothetical protein CB0940_02363 [Cercospora beticola]PIA98794.1 hypothetical protein CB0940_02363 [Cercospora beticola]